MSGSAKIPTALRVVAYIHLIVGILSVIGFIVPLFHGTISPQFGILYIPIFFGLINLRNGWRVCAMVFLWFGLVTLPILFFLALLGVLPTYFEVFGTKSARVPGWIGAVATVPFFVLVLWQYRVLVRPNVRRLFYSK